MRSRDYLADFVFGQFGVLSFDVKFGFNFHRYLRRVAVVLSSSLLLANPLARSTKIANGSSSGEWKLIWSDEFNSGNGPAVDPTKWIFETGGAGWGNNELETYTNRSQNAHIDGGALVITALRENFTVPDHVTRNFTSARLNTKGKFSLMYGRVEARIRIPYGQGLWPAVWLLGANIDQVGWPACGEIDIMENIGREPSLVHATIHGPGYSGGKGIGGPYSLAHGRFADDFHI